jgi:hypothetical protein
MLTDTNRTLLTRLTDLLRREHAALADFLLALAEFDRRHGWRELGYAGLFPFLHRELQLSKAAAYFRKTAAELVQRFPEIVDPIRDGRLCLTTVVELSKVLTRENLDSVLPRFFHCSKQEAKAITAELVPEDAPAYRTIVTALPLATPTVRPERGGREAATEPKGGQSALETWSQTVRPGEPLSREGTTSVSPLHTAPRDTTEPLTSDLRRLHITVSKRFLDKLDVARSALSHSIPGATTEQILEAALDLVLAKDAKMKGLVAKPRPAPATPPEPGERYVPAAVRRAVWKRDEGKCQWPLEGGGICGSTYQVELDHTRPVGQGGRSTVDGTRLLCKPHNHESARRTYSDAWMDRFTRRTPTGTG